MGLIHRERALEQKSHPRMVCFEARANLLYKESIIVCLLFPQWGNIGLIPRAKLWGKRAEVSSKQPTGYGKGFPAGLPTVYYRN